MIRHIFMGTFKEGISQEIKDKELVDMKAMKDKIPGVADLKVGFSTGWVGGNADRIVMTVDFEKKEDFEVYMNHPYHVDYIDKTGTEYFDRETFVVAQIEFED